MKTVIDTNVLISGIYMVTHKEYTLTDEYT